MYKISTFRIHEKQYQILSYLLLPQKYESLLQNVDTCNELKDLTDAKLCHLVSSHRNI